MKLGLFTSCLGDRPLHDVLPVMKEAGLTSLEVCVGGFLPSPHLHTELLLSSQTARDEYLGLLTEHGVQLTALNVNGNPIHPDREVAGKHAKDLFNAIQLAGLLGVRNIVAMSGTPGEGPAGKYPAWVSVFPWDSAYSTVLDYQWNDVAIPFWKSAGAAAEAAGVRIAIEMHPHLLVYNPPTLDRLITETGSPAIGVEMDPSHLFWQGVDPIAVVHQFGDRVFNAAAKDTRINADVVKTTGLIDNAWVPLGFKFDIGGSYLLNGRPAARPWEFVAPGRGHDVAFWSDLLGALQQYDPDIAINIENEDEELSPIEGISQSAETLHAAVARLPQSALNH